MSIALRHISLAYGDRRLLEDVSADFAPQTLTALIGRNGTGKSTLLRPIRAVRVCGAKSAETSSSRRRSP